MQKGLNEKSFILANYGKLKLAALVQNNRKRIFIPESLQANLMDWFHENLSHPGQKRMYNTMALYYTWKGMKEDINKFVGTCEKCQKNKKTTIKYGKLPIRNDVASDPFHTVQVDLVGPWKIEIAQANSKVAEKEIKAVTIIDVGTLLLEVVPYHNRKLVSIANIFDQEWLCRYPRPAQVIHDNGSEFIGAEFQEMLHSFDITPVPTTVKNPQANLVIKQVHLTMGDCCRMEKFKFGTWEEQTQTVFSSIMWAIRSTLHSVVAYNPGQLAFNRDMLMRTKVVVDWELIKQRQIKATQQANKQENNSRIKHKYKVGDNVLIIL